MHDAAVHWRGEHFKAVNEGNNANKSNTMQL